MTIVRAFAQWMEDNGFGTFDTDLFIGTVPVERDVTSAWWIVSGGGSPTLRNQTGEKMKAYTLAVFYRSRDAELVDTLLQQLEDALNNKECKTLAGYDTIDIEATGFQTDRDIDGEDRVIGSIEITVTVYQS